VSYLALKKDQPTIDEVIHRSLEKDESFCSGLYRSYGARAHVQGINTIYCITIQFPTNRAQTVDFTLHPNKWKVVDSSVDLEVCASSFSGTLPVGEKLEVKAEYARTLDQDEVAQGPIKIDKIPVQVPQEVSQIVSSLGYTGNSIG
jgi:hypothetical protein